MNFFNRILNIGIVDENNSDVKRIRILNGVAFYSALILIFNGIMIFATSYPFESFTLREFSVYLMSGPENKIAEVDKFRLVFPMLDFFLAFIAVSSLVLNYFRRHYMSALMICLIANLYVAFFYWLSGFFSAFFFFIPALLPLIFFQKTKRYLPFVIFTLIIFLALTIIKFRIGVDDLFLQPPADKALLNSLLNFTAVFGILYFIVYHFKKENIKNESILREQNLILDEQAKEIRKQRDELHLANSELSDSEKELKDMNATKDKFITILAHDLRNPFNSLLGFSELLIKNYNEFNEDEVKNQLESIYETSKSTFNLLEQILIWVKSQSGKLTLQPSEFNYIEVANEMINEFKGQASKKQIEISAIDSANLTLTTDINMFKTIVRNLISNGIKFTDRNGRIIIRAELDNQVATITVSDTGTGIKSDVIPRLWEIGEGYSTEGTENEIGTGFGLKLCRELIDKLGGEIWVESELGKGSDFKFTLPQS